MQGLASFLCGLVFGAGLMISGMTQPAKVLGFLDIFGRWDPVGAVLAVVQTDVTDRGEAYETAIGAQEAFALDGDMPGSARLAASPWAARGNREKRAEQDGIPVVRLRYRRR